MPYQYIGQEVKVIYTRNTVSAYCKGEMIATHIRDYTPNGYTTLPEHMASNCLAARTISSQTYIDRANRVNELLGVVIAKLFQQNTQVPEETYFKSCDGLLYLQKHTSPDLFNLACQTAINMNQCRYSFVKNMIETKCSGLETIPTQDNPPQHGNIRGKEQFQ